VASQTPQLMRILLVSSWFPYPPDNGSRIRAHNILKTLAAKHEVTLLAFTDAEFLPEHADALSPMCRAVVTTPRIAFQPTRGRALAAFLSPQPRFIVDTHSAVMQHMLDEQLAHGNFDILVAGELSAAMYVRGDTRPAKIFDDLETGIFYDAFAQARGATRWRRALTWWKMARYLRARAQVFDAVTVVSKREEMLAIEIAVPPTRLSILPNGIDCAAYQNVDERKKPNSLIYSGALTYAANLDAMRYFVREILPLVRSSAPDARLTITGRAEQVAINELSDDNAVLLTGYVPDVRPFIASSRVCIVPLRFGGGTRLKILEAMALGTPVVSTGKGIEGLDVTAGQDVLVGDSPQEFASHVLALLRDQELSTRIAKNARAKISELYDWKKIGARLDELILQVPRDANG